MQQVNIQFLHKVYILELITSLQYITVMLTFLWNSLPELDFEFQLF